MSESQNNNTVYCSFVSIHYIICECGETFPNEDDLKTHLETEHPHKIEKKEFSCGLCEEAFTSEEACLLHHQESHTVRIIKPPSPPPVKYIIQPLSVRGVPLKTEEDMDSYEHYQSRSQFNNNIQELEDNKCEIYQSEIPYYDSIQELEADGCMIVTSGKHPGTRKKKKYPKKNIKNRVCEVCGKKYASNAALRYHQRVHTGEKPYQCSYCDKAFTMPLFLQIHHRIHTGEKPYQCPHCPKAFGNKAALLRHDRVHTGIKPYTCPHCFKSFTQSNSMKLHVHTVHLRLPTPYKSKRRRERLATPQVIRKAQRNPDAPRGPRLTVPRSPLRMSLPRGSRVLHRDQVVMRSFDVTNTASDVVKSWTPVEQGADGLTDVADMCVVKTEDEFAEEEGEGVFYDHETGQEVLYEVVYQ